MSKDWEKKITQKIVLLYEKPRPNRGDKNVLNNFLRTTNLTYMCRMIYNGLFKIVMPRVRSRDYVSDKDCFCMYKIMVGEKVNLPEIIFFYLMQGFKDMLNPKVKKNPIPYGILFTHIMRLAEVDISLLEPSSRTTQLNGATFVNMGITENFLEYVQRHIKKKVKKEVIDAPSSCAN